MLKNNESSVIDKKIQDFEKTFNIAVQEYPEEAFLLDAESKFNELLADYPGALDSLEKAFSINEGSPYVATRLSNYYLKTDQQKSKEILEKSLKINQYDKNLNFLYSKVLINLFPEDYINHRHYLRNSFIKNDKRYEAQFWYARCLYLVNEKEEATQFFNIIKNAPVDYRTKKNNRGMVVFDGAGKIFDGVVIKLERSYGFVKENITGETIYFYRNRNLDDRITINKNITFNKMFNYYGVNATILL